jgi:hypothetical protein
MLHHLTEDNLKLVKKIEKYNEYKFKKVKENKTMMEAMENIYHSRNSSPLDQEKIEEYNNEMKIQMYAIDEIGPKQLNVTTES